MWSLHTFLVILATEILISMAESSSGSMTGIFQTSIYTLFIPKLFCILISEQK